MNIIERAFQVAVAVEQFREHARGFYYEVALAGRECPQCGGDLRMAGEGKCRCVRCGSDLNPTIAFQRCSGCGGEAKLSIRRYVCRGCGADMPSLFLFDGLVFDADYFRQKMVESRQRRQELRESVRRMLTESRSGAVLLPPMELEADLIGALDSLSSGPVVVPFPEHPDRFDLNRYQAHIRAHLEAYAVSLDEIPPLSENTRKDRVWRFIAIVFLAHAGILDVWQDGPDVMVSKREIDAEGREFLEALKALMESNDLRVELKPDRPSRMVLRGTYGDKIHQAFRMSRQGVRWRFQRLFNDVYVSAFETILFIESVFGPHLREHAIRISKERYELRQQVRPMNFEPRHEPNQLGPSNHEAGYTPGGESAGDAGHQPRVGAER